MTYGNGVTVSYAYDYVYNTADTVRPDMITGVKRNGATVLSYSYDNLNRLSRRTYGTSTPYYVDYYYLQGNDYNKTTPLVGTVELRDVMLVYHYDAVGNIISVDNDFIEYESYSYDSMNQLISYSIANSGDTYAYSYDNGGNILSVNQNGETIKTFTYGDTEWKDLLTAFNGNAITYDNIGNPLTYHDGSTFTWSNGRKLTGITKGTDSISYAYDANGLRTSKTVNGVTTEYYWFDGTLYAEKTGSQYIYYHYDDNGIAYGFTVVNGSTSTDYYYVHNLQGDVIQIVDSTGTVVVYYSYDPWGEMLSITGTLATTLGATNPIRYRGYYYDTETGFYYCRARYYDPEICRWINADGYISTGQGLLSNNMFAYCLNNPVNLSDYTGELPVTTIILIISIVCGGVAFGVTSYNDYKCYGDIDLANSISSGLNAFCFVYSFGMTGYSFYIDYCNYKGYVPITDINFPKTNSYTSLVPTSDFQNFRPYSSLEDPPNVAPGKDFTAAQKRQIIELNRQKNGGVVRSDYSGKLLYPPEKSMKGITPSPDEWQIDHIIPKSMGGTNSFSNAQVLSREENRLKWDKIK